ncbi:DUF393 domain-containing protein [Macrococcus equipercicus]|uniref:DUF393 domain-containing protein n=1 Tax=Macrococcus equipercicus TaxID=69967 RepID=A0ABQ6R657_9STAP|nr:DUF393 domain-containing protein [Macrococcus equipercicus]
MIDINIIYFDDECSFCNGYIKILISLVKNDVFRFSSNKSHNIRLLRDTLNVDSIILHHDNKYYFYSDALLKIFEILGYKVWFFYLIPKFIRNCIYKFFSLNRKKFQKNYCFLPDDSIRHKFIDIN